MKYLSWALGVALIAAAATLGSAAQATPVASVNDAAAQLNTVEHAQYYYGGRRYCFYPDGWNGPGWYRCGYHLRRGYGWGGVEGWHGWRYGHPPHRYDRHRYYR